MDQPAQALGHARHLDCCVTVSEPTHLEAFPRVCECSEQRSENHGVPGSSPGLAISRGRIPPWELESLLVGGLADESLAARVPSAFSHNC